MRLNGTFYKVPKSIVNPKPVQKPHPPITVGGFNPLTFERAVNPGNGYNGIIMPFEQMKVMIDGLKKAAEASNRNFSELQAAAGSDFLCEPDLSFIVYHGSCILHIQCLFFSVFSISKTLRVAFITESGLRDIESIPSFTRNSANSG